MTEYRDDKLRAAVEAILFTMGRAVDSSKIAAALKIGVDELHETVAAMQEKYDREDSGIRIIRLDDAYQMCTKAEYYEALISIASQPVKPVMTGALLEVLSIIAYKQPVTRGEIERIRGVSSDYSVNRLIEYGLIEEAGRLEAPGRPILFATTEDFLRQFGLSSVRELPEISDDTLEEAREYAYRTAGYEMEGQLSLELQLNGSVGMKEDVERKASENEPVMADTNMDGTSGENTEVSAEKAEPGTEENDAEGTEAPAALSDEYSPVNEEASDKDNGIPDWLEGDDDTPIIIEI